MKKFLSLLMLFVSLNTYAKTYYVSTTGNDNNDGTSWAKAFRTVSRAVNEANYSLYVYSDTIWVAKGTYYESINVSKDLAIVGGFAGNETLKSQRISGNKTILRSGDKTTITCQGSSGKDVILEDLTIYGGSESAILNIYMNLKVNSCYIGNTLYGIENRANLTITNSYIINNSYGIYDRTSGAKSTITNCTILYNDTGIYCNVSGSKATNCILYNNDFNFGGITLSYSNCLFTDPKFGTKGNHGGFIDTYPVLTGSPAIGKGTSSGAPTLDARGVTRHSHPTIGAYEYNGDIPNYVYITTSSEYYLEENTYNVSVDSDGTPSTYKLYRDGVEIASSTSPSFSLKAQGIGNFQYHVTVEYNGTVVESSKITKRQFGQILRVSESGEDTGTGNSWEDALSSVSSALSIAKEIATDDKPIQIWVKNGTYNISSPLSLASNVEVYGGFAGTETSLDERTEGNETIFTTTGSNYIISNLSSWLTKAKIDTITIKGAQCAIYNEASPTIENCTFIENDYAIYNSGAYETPIIKNCTIANNKYGIRNDASKPNIINCTITNNSNYGIYSNSSAAPTITNSIIWGNGDNEIEHDSSSVPILNSCVVKGGYDANEDANIITQDPLIGELGYYGGNVQTIPVFRYSSAIGKGTTGDTIPKKDARGVERPEVPTIGAYEPSTTIPTIIYGKIDVSTLMINQETTITVYSDGSPKEYILCKNGVEIKSQSSNVFTITSKEAGTSKYTVKAKYGDTVIESEEIISHFITNRIYVSETGDDNNSGSSWNDSYSCIKTAIEMASRFASSENLMEIWVAKGTYSAGDSNFVIPNYISIHGGFAGTETSLSERTNGNDTILTSTSSAVIYNNYTEETPLENALIDGLIILGGSEYGIYNANSSLIILNCIVKGSKYGICNEKASTPIIINCTISENTDGIRNNQSFPSIDKCSILKNTNSGIYNYESNPTITNCDISENISYGIYNTSSNSNIGLCLFSNNGVGIYNYKSNPKIISCDIIENTGTGISNNNSSSPNIENCVLYLNKGNGIYNNGSSPYIANSEILSSSVHGISNVGVSDPTIDSCTSWGNAQSGIYNDFVASPQIVNCTISENGGNGIYIYEPNTATDPSGTSTRVTNCTITLNATCGINNQLYTSLTVTNCIIWDNIGLQVNRLLTNCLLISNCIVQNQTTTNNVRSVDPLLGEIGYYGGTVPTIPITSASSPAIGAGVSGNLIPTDDARGYARANPPTLGAFEFAKIPIKKDIQNLTVYSGNSASFTIEAEAGVSFNWRASAQVDSNLFTIETDSEKGISTLTINPISVEFNSMKIDCVLTKPYFANTNSTEVTLTVLQSATITAQPSDVEVYSGKDAQLSVTAQGDGNISYQWYKDGQILNGETNNTLTLKSADASSNGAYHCVVSNGGGAVQSDIANVSVHQSATDSCITKDLPNTIYTVSKTGKARFEIETTAHNPTYKWYWGDGETWNEIGENSNVLSVDAEDRFNRQSFKCEISNGGGTVTSNVSLLRYSSTAIKITEQPQNKTSSLNENVKFAVNATTSTNNVSYQWQVSSDKKIWTNIDGATDNTLSITLDSYSKCVYYRVEVNNGGGVLNSDEVTLNANITVISQPQNASAVEGNIAEFNIKLDNSDNVKFQWQVQKKGENSWSNIDKANTDTLKITMESTLSGNKYRCKYSLLGVDNFSNSATLQLAEQLKITREPEPIESIELNLTVKFTVETNSDTAKYQWQKKTLGVSTWEDIANETSNTLSIKVSSEDVTEYDYRCKIWNETNVAIYSGVVYIGEVLQPSTKSPYEQWTVENGLVGDTAKADAKPFADGITNLEKYAFGLNASRATSYAESNLFKQSKNDTNVLFQFPLNANITLVGKSKTASGIVAQVYASTDLKTWEVVNATLTTETSGELKIYKVEIPIPTGGKLFFKVDVTEN